MVTWSTVCGKTAPEKEQVFYVFLFIFLHFSFMFPSLML